MVAERHVQEREVVRRHIARLRRRFEVLEDAGGLRAPAGPGVSEPDRGQHGGTPVVRPRGDLFERLDGAVVAALAFVGEAERVMQARVPGIHLLRLEALVDRFLVEARQIQDQLPVLLRGRRHRIERERSIRAWYSRAIARAISLCSSRMSSMRRSKLSAHRCVWSATRTSCAVMRTRPSSAARSPRARATRRARGRSCQCSCRCACSASLTCARSRAAGGG
jgi:hypothetical protein